ncbi:ATP-binding protein [Xylophilus sp.]|uniref:ATP-binding protein n=1 Tax=Xylophilus sp. TaxID=2653893 RepID=UPI0013B9C3D8|nr:ATP-binding protein [Xylophilus sp.]KAF1044715.1 MAG: Signal transduction histidine-protein kinase/phosphatase MprB [Xylophilus sp.]
MLSRLRATLQRLPQPRGMAGQLLFLLLAGFAVSHLIGVTLMSRDVGAVHPLAWRQAAERVAQVAHGVQRLPAGVDAAAVLDAFGSPRARWRLGTGAPAPHRQLDADLARDEADILAALQARLGGSARAVAAQVDVPDGDARHGRLALWVQLPDGRWLASDQALPLRRRWWWPMSFWFQMGLVPVALIAALSARRLLRPSRTLVEAAGRVSRGERVEPLPLEGPQEMRDMIQTFNDMQARLRCFVEDRTRMLAAIGHDFRTPITSLRLRAELVEDAALRAAMVRTLDGMTAMVDETLRFARDDAADEATETVDLRQLIDAQVQEQAALGHDVHWAGDALPLPYRCRPASVQRAFGNLLDNAVRYGRRARVRLLPAAGTSVHIEVEDDGPGIPEALVETAFASFTRLADSARGEPPRAGGVVLGLAIARSCARSHGGDVHLLRPDGGGLCARIVLP